MSITVWLDSDEHGMLGGFTALNQEDRSCEVGAYLVASPDVAYGVILRPGQCRKVEFHRRDVLHQNLFCVYFYEAHLSPGTPADTRAK